MNLQKLRYFPPYKEKRKCSFKNLNRTKGVYIIKENNVIVYIGKSNYDLYKTLYRHFQRWNDKRLYRVTYIDYMSSNSYLCAVIPTSDILETDDLEKRLIFQEQPRDNREKYEKYNNERLIQEQPLEEVKEEELVDIPF
jgi:Uri superfamily endonuclease